MGLVQNDAFKTMVISYLGIGLGYLNKGLLFILLLSTEQIGIINLILAVGVLFAQFANLGTVFTTWKFLPYFKDESKKHHGFFPLMFLFVAIGIILFTLLCILFRTEIQQVYESKSPEFNHYYYWILPIGIGSALFMLLESYLRSFYKNIVSVVSYELILRAFITLLLLLFWVKWIDFEQLLICHSIVYLIPALILLCYLYAINELNFSFRSIQISKKFRKIIIQYAGFNYINTFGAILVQSLDVIMIASLIGLEGTGVYATIVFLASALLVPYRSMARISSPLVADYWKHREMDKMKELYTKFSSVSLLIGLASFMWIWMNIEFLFSFLPADKQAEFQPGIWVFFFLMMGRLLDMFFGLNGAIFSTSKKFKYDIVFTLILIVGVYGLNLLFIPYWGIIGAAISTGISLVFYNVARILFVWKIFKIHPFTTNQFIVIGIGVVTIVLGEFVADYISNLWIRTGVETGLFILCFILPIFIFNLETESKNFVLKFWKRLKP